MWENGWAKFRDVQQFSMTDMWYEREVGQVTRNPIIKGLVFHVR